MAILGKQGVEKDHKFVCVDCNDVVTGADVLNGEYLYIVSKNLENPKNSQFRCECCQDDLDDRE
jgi:hypothetical protein